MNGSDCPRKLQRELCYENDTTLTVGLAAEAVRSMLPFAWKAACLLFSASLLICGFLDFGRGCRLGELRTETVMYFVFAVLFALTPFLIIPYTSGLRLMRKQCRRMNTRVPHMTVSFYSDCMEMRSADGRIRKESYISVIACKTTKRLLLVLLPDGVSLILRRDSFHGSTAGEAERFLLAKKRAFRQRTVRGNKRR